MSKISWLKPAGVTVIRFLIFSSRNFAVSFQIYRPALGQKMFITRDLEAKCLGSAGSNVVT